MKLLTVIVLVIVVALAALGKNLQGEDSALQAQQLGKIAIAYLAGHEMHKPHNDLNKEKRGQNETNRERITCPGQFLDIDGCCYYFSSNEGKTWNDAKKACQDLGSILEKYVSLAEVKDGTCHTGALMEAITHRGKWVWLGATGVNNVWTWNTSGRSLSVKNSYWQETQPGRTSPGDCMVGFIWGHYQRAYFGDHPCTKEYDFVCQIF